MRVPALVSALVLITWPSWAANPEPNCSAPTSNYDARVCGGRKLEAAKQEMSRYLDASRRKTQGDGKALAALDESQKTWQAYKGAQCNAIYTKWREGSIAGVLGVECEVALTKARTHELWKVWLTYADSSLPVLPEPDL